MQTNRFKFQRSRSTTGLIESRPGRIAWRAARIGSMLFSVRRGLSPGHMEYLIQDLSQPFTFASIFPFSHFTHSSIPSFVFIETRKIVVFGFRLFTVLLNSSMSKSV